MGNKILDSGSSSSVDGYYVASYKARASKSENYTADVVTRRRNGTVTKVINHHAKGYDRDAPHPNYQTGTLRKNSSYSEVQHVKISSPRTPGVLERRGSKDLVSRQIDNLSAFAPIASRQNDLAPISESGENEHSTDGTLNLDETIAQDNDYVHLESATTTSEEQDFLPKDRIQFSARATPEDQIKLSSRSIPEQTPIPEPPSIPGPSSVPEQPAIPEQLVYSDPAGEFHGGFDQDNNDPRMFIRAATQLLASLTEVSRRLSWNGHRRRSSIDNWIQLENGPFTRSQSPSSVITARSSVSSRRMRIDSSIDGATVIPREDQQPPPHKRLCYYLLTGMSAAVSISLVLSSWWIRKTEDLSGAFTLGAYVVTVGAFVIMVPLAFHVPHCRCWKT
ncbi:hypothetical protein F5Y16DRAFT_245542 [Xylariaceae sp. FL0255]|nr:hypothetical protein F5Y16DRAFT_245542 [Xylariaceae sp. FL0255]